MGSHPNKTWRVEVSGSRENWGGGWDERDGIEYKGCGVKSCNELVLDVDELKFEVEVEFEEDKIASI